ncbi:hypothetical protein FBQ97_04865 [Acidobacteria bacterium ACD]|nr:MAG: hypothetical protein EDX89_01595 [Acidobacteriota bacterium]MCE7959405.1 hypothetical protein [Acidobacteria bacterium ACB2]MDL1949130.1 hypothetical protein [Acidobacteria bacterium ACD]
MNPTDDPLDAPLASLGRSTAASAPAPAPPAVIRALAARRAAEVGARKLLVLLAVATAVPVPVLITGWILSPPGPGRASTGALLVAFSLALSISGLARLLAAGTPAARKAPARA